MPLSEYQQAVRMFRSDIGIFDMCSGQARLCGQSAIKWRLEGEFTVGSWSKSPVRDTGTRSTSLEVGPDGVR